MSVTLAGPVPSGLSTTRRLLRGKARDVERQPHAAAAAEAPKGRAYPAATLDVYLWTVRFGTDDSERTVVARTIEEAAQLAIGAFPPRVTAITLLGEAVLRGATAGP